MQKVASQPSRREWIALFTILATLFAALAFQAWRLGVTVDEPGHLISAHFYWHANDVLKPGDMPPLMKVIGGWPSLFFKLPVPYDYPAVWNSQQEAPIAAETMVRMGYVRSHWLYFASRLTLTIFPLLTAFLLWYWGRQLFNPTTGLLLALLFSAEPTALGHGALFKNDHAAAFTFFFFWFRAWRLWRNPSNRNVLWLACALVLACAAKMSLLILVGITPLLIALRYWRTPLRAFAAILATFAILYLGLLTLYQFDTKLLTTQDLARATYRGMPEAFGLFSKVFSVLPIPRLLWDGACELFFSNASASPVYILGTLYNGGHPHYFLIAMALKLPHSFQLLFIAGLLILSVHLWKSATRTTALFVVLPPVLYVGLASLSSFQLGLRLILPAFPFAMLIAGGAIHWLLARKQYWLLAAMIAWLGIRSISVYPFGITYFNQFAGGPGEGLRYLADSNLDWGHALPETAEFCRANGIKKIKLSYFGLDIPRHYFAENEIELIPPPWEDKYAKGMKWEPEPGYYAISASLLPGFLFQTKYADYYENFRNMQPIGKPGNAIYIYKVTVPVGVSETESGH